MNTHVQVFEYLFSILLGHIPRTRIGGSNGNPMFNLLRTDKLFSIVAAPFYIPIAIYEGSNFSTSSYPLVIFCFIFIIAIQIGINRQLIVVLICISLMTNSGEGNGNPLQ